eukprot:TRINITY_DN10910_c0_g6_i4.p1 TRINITY_DN10910_c0_g6~~TRINITY_DN10910_c0_g6_i4.p1  ORF type:complete len:818 (+),score=207.14 TRINITY_DN10910_c0_g6_i4:1742-4195(+)
MAKRTLSQLAASVVHLGEVPALVRLQKLLAPALVPRGAASCDSAGGSRGGAYGGNPWEGRRFFVQVERCGALSNKSVSVRHDEEKYLKHTAALKEGIESFFAKQLPVEAVEVQVPYAMEVRVMPWDLHPQEGRRCVMEAAETSGAETLFSKMQSKRWPKPEMILQSLVDFCRVPVRITLVAKVSSSGAEAAAQAALQAADGDGFDAEDPRARQATGSPPPTPVAHAHLVCAHAATGMITPSHPVITDGDGRCEVSLFPGNFTVSCQEESKYDKLIPNVLVVPAAFSTLEVTIVASVKKQCTILVVDHFDRPFAHFPLQLAPRDAPNKVQSLRTKLDGKCKCRLGCGVVIASCRAGPDGRMPAEAFSTALEVQDTHLPQLFRVQVFRLLFGAEVMLRTRFGTCPAHVPFTISSEAGEVLVSRASSDIGLVAFDAAPGRYTLRVDPPDDAPFMAHVESVVVSDDGDVSPRDLMLETKNADVRILLVTPDGQPAPDCLFHLSPQFEEDAVPNASASKQMKFLELPFRSDASGTATATLALLEPYWFRVKSCGTVMEYMPQEFSFQTDRRSITAVVARSVFGQMPEERIAILVDASGSMQVYLEDVKVALNSALVEQFARSSKRFTICAFSENQVLLQQDLVHCSAKHVEEAMRFVASLEPGGGSDAAAALTRAFALPDIDAIYFVTDGKCDIGEVLLNKVRALFFAHKKRPKLNTIGINCVPQRTTWRGLSAMADFTKGVFRPVNLQQENIDPVAAALRRGVSGAGGGLELAPQEEEAGADTEREVEHAPRQSDEEAELTEGAFLESSDREGHSGGEPFA